MGQNTAEALGNLQQIQMNERAKQMACPNVPISRHFATYRAVFTSVNKTVGCSGFGRQVRDQNIAATAPGVQRLLE